MDASKNGKQNIGDLIELSALGLDAPLPTVPGQPVGGDGTSFEHDLIARRRDGQGNPVPRSIAYSHPVSGSQDLEATGFVSLTEEIKEKDPIRGLFLESLYKDRVRPAYQRLQGVREEVEQELAELRSLSLRTDAVVDRAVNALEAKREEALETPRAIEAKDWDLLQAAHEDASEKVSLTGGTYDPAGTHEHVVLRVEPVAEGVAATRLKVPYGDGAKRAQLPIAMSWLGTVLCGCLIGVSAAVAGGFLQSQDLLTKPKLGQIVAACVLGFGAALFIRWALRMAWYLFAESMTLRRPLREQLGWFSAAVLTFVSLSAVVLSTDRQGLLRAAQTQSEWSSDAPRTPEWVFWCVAGVLSLGYLIYAAYEGIVKGREDALANSVKAEVATDAKAREEVRRAETTVQQALHSLSRATIARRRHEASSAHRQGLESAFGELIARAQARRIAYPLTWTDEMRLRVQDARDNLEGAQLELDGLVDEAVSLLRRVREEKGR